jgi:hypothetical protein
MPGRHRRGPGEEEDADAYARNANDDSYRAELTRRVTSLAAGDRALPWRAL